MQSNSKLTSIMFRLITVRFLTKRKVNFQYQLLLTKLKIEKKTSIAVMHQYGVFRFDHVVSKLIRCFQI